MARSSIAVFGGKLANVQGSVALQKKLAAIPDKLIAKIKPALEKGADDMLAVMKPIIPVSDLEAQPGQLRDSAHREDGRHELSVAVVVDAVDEKGRAFAKHVEHGHKAPDGSHVAAEPFFWPSYNITRKKIRSRVARAMSAGVKEANAVRGPDEPGA